MRNTSRPKATLPFPEAWRPIKAARSTVYRRIQGIYPLFLKKADMLKKSWKILNTFAALQGSAKNIKHMHQGLRRALLPGLALLLLHNFTYSQGIGTPADNTPNDITAPSGPVTSTTISYPPAFSGTVQGLHHTEKRVYKRKERDTLTTAEYAHYFQDFDVFNGAGNTVFEIRKRAVVRDGSFASYVKLHDRSYGTRQKSYLDFSEVVPQSQVYYPDLFDKQKDYYQQRYPNEGATAVSYTENTSTANKRSVTRYAPGMSNIGKGQGSETIIDHNNGRDRVRRWSYTPSSKRLEVLGFYVDKQLLKTTTVSETGAISVVYKLPYDPGGHLQQCRGYGGHEPANAGQLRQPAAAFLPDLYAAGR